MNKNQFLTALENGLAKLPVNDRAEILQDYEEYFENGREAGRTETEIVEKLGSVQSLAKELSAGYQIETVKNNATVGNAVRAIFAVGALGFFNLLFVLAPAIAVYGVLFSLWITAALSSVSVVLFLVFSGLGLQAFYLFDFFAALAFSGVGIFLLLATMKLSKWVVQITLKYLAFNLKIIKGGE
jgi:uncharacterized membrane protein